MPKIPDLQYKTLPVLHPPRAVLPSDESLPCIYIFQKYQPYSLQGLPLPQKDPLKVPYVVDCTVYSPTGVPRKVSALTFVVFSGISKEVSAVLSNTKFSKITTPFPEKEARERQPAKAPVPSLSTLSGRMTCARLLHSKNAPFPIIFNVSGNTTSSFSQQDR